MTPINLNDFQEFAVLMLWPLALLSGGITIAAVITVLLLGLLDNVFNSD